MCEHKQKEDNGTLSTGILYTVRFLKPGDMFYHNEGKTINLFVVLKIRPAKYSGLILREMVVDVYSVRDKKRRAFSDGLLNIGGLHIKL